MEKRSAKRISIVILYLVFFAVVLFGLYTIIKPEATCSDGIKNQLEEGIDCGGPCAPCEDESEIQDLIVNKVEWVDTATDKIDTVITIENPNSDLGSSMVKYRLKYINSSGATIQESKWFKGFILPQQEKYFLVQEAEVLGTPVDIEVELGDVVWKKFTADQENPRLEVILAEFSNSFQQDPSGFYRVKGTLVNESSLDLEEIKINVVLRDDGGNLLVTNSQVINTVHSQEKRDFNISFSSDYRMNEVAEVEIKPETDIFNSDNYVKFFGIVSGEN